MEGIIRSSDYFQSPKQPKPGKTPNQTHQKFSNPLQKSKSKAIKRITLRDGAKDSTWILNKNQLLSSGKFKNTVSKFRTFKRKDQPVYRKYSSLEPFRTGFNHNTSLSETVMSGTKNRTGGLKIKIPNHSQKSYVSMKSTKFRITDGMKASFLALQEHKINKKGGKNFKNVFFLTKGKKPSFPKLKPVSGGERSPLNGSLRVLRDTDSSGWLSFRSRIAKKKELKISPKNEFYETLRSQSGGTITPEVLMASDKMTLDLFKRLVLDPKYAQMKIEGKPIRTRKQRNLSKSQTKEASSRSTKPVGDRAITLIKKLVEDERLRCFKPGKTISDFQAFYESQEFKSFQKDKIILLLLHDFEEKFKNLINEFLGRNQPLRLILNFLQDGKNLVKNQNKDRYMAGRGMRFINQKMLFELLQENFSITDIGHFELHWAYVKSFKGLRKTGEQVLRYLPDRSIVDDYDKKKSKSSKEALKKLNYKENNNYKVFKSYKINNILKKSSSTRSNLSKILNEAPAKRLEMFKESLKLSHKYFPERFMDTKNQEIINLILRGKVISEYQERLLEEKEEEVFEKISEVLKNVNFWNLNLKKRGRENMFITREDYEFAYHLDWNPQAGNNDFKDKSIFVVSKVDLIGFWNQALLEKIFELGWWSARRVRLPVLPFNVLEEQEETKEDRVIGSRVD